MHDLCHLKKLGFGQSEFMRMKKICKCLLMTILFSKVSDNEVKTSGGCRHTRKASIKD